MKRLGVSTAIISLCLLMLPVVVVAQEVPPNCGDEVIQWRQGETCDPPGEPCGAGGSANFMCNEFCQCVPAEPTCGDGIVQWKAGEECEPGMGEECGMGRYCDPTSCVCVEEPGPVQACCVEDGICQDVTVRECRELGGIPQGMDTDCSTVDCPEPPPQPEACCMSDGACGEVEPEVCTSLGGIPQGLDSTCVASSCEPVCECPEAYCSYFAYLGRCASTDYSDCTFFCNASSPDDTYCDTVCEAANHRVSGFCPSFSQCP
jgi:hypothetical protein